MSFKWETNRKKHNVNGVERQLSDLTVKMFVRLFEPQGALNEFVLPFTNDIHIQEVMNILFFVEKSVAIV